MNNSEQSKPTHEGQYAQILSSARQAIREGLKKAGDIIEAAGDKVEHTSLKRLGEWIEGIGNTIEHLGETQQEANKSDTVAPLRSGDPFSANQDAKPNSNPNTRTGT